MKPEYEKMGDLWAENNRNKARVQKAIKELKWLSKTLGKVAPKCYDEEDTIQNLAGYCKDAIRQIEKEAV